MSQDFVFINPRNIPPRRASPQKRSSSKKKRSPRYLPEAGLEEIDYGMAPEFDAASEFYGQVVLSGSPPSFAADAGSLGASWPETDPLTQAIFGQLPAEAKSEAKEPARPAEPQAVQTAMSQPLDDSMDRSQVLAELERINEADNKLSKKIARLVSSGRTSPLNIKRSVSAGRAAADGQTGATVQIQKKDSGVLEPDDGAAETKPEDIARAQDDWFQVGLANRIWPKEKLPRLHKNRSRDEADPGRGRFKTFLAGLAAVIIPLTFGLLIFSQRPNFVKNAMASLNNKLLSATSFTFVNTAGSSIFVEVSEIKELLSSLGDSAGASALIDEFLEKNSGFSWLNIFKKKALGSGSVSIAGVELLDQAQASLVSLASGGAKNAGQSLAGSVSFLNFWNQFFSAGQVYAVAVLDDDSPQPMGGRPVSYGFFRTTPEGLEIIGSGRLDDVDAAVSVKIIPPRPLQSASTSWLPSQAGWFLGFDESAQTLLGFFENITQTKFDGLMAVSKDFLASVSFRESLIFDAGSPGWFYGLNEALSRKPDQRWVGLARDLETGLESHKVQFYFKNPAAADFVAGQNWAITSSAAARQDILGVSWFHLEGSNPKLELVEDKVSVFEDGSMVAKLTLNIKPDNGASLDYFKIYLPLGVQIMKAAGFSEKEKTPGFDYSASGFTADSRVKTAVVQTRPEAASVLEKIDFFEEDDWSVAGGWLKLDSEARQSLSLEYLLPFRLDRKKTLANYNLKVWRPHQQEDTSFRFNLSPEKGVNVVSLKPDGFISGGAGEFQTNLSRDAVLEGALVFPGE